MRDIFDIMDTIYSNRRRYGEISHPSFLPVNIHASSMLNIFQDETHVDPRISTFCQ